jgi:hypothetical protein
LNSKADTFAAQAERFFAKPFGGVVRIECTDDGSSLWIDGREGEPVVGEKAPADLSGRFSLWRGSSLVLHSVLSGQRRLETAFTTGQLKISGDMAVMARLEPEGVPA